MANYNNPGPLKFGEPGAVIDSTVHSRRLYNFGDRVADLAPEESPFFVYLSKVAKVPTDDPQFRWLKDRNKIQMADRSFLLNASHTVAAAGSTLSYTVDDGSAYSVGWLIKGMVFAVGETNNSTKEPETAIVRIESAPVSTGTEGSNAQTAFTGRTISAATGSTTSAEDNVKCTVIGSAFEEGSGAPDSWARELENGSGYCQIFKTSAELTNTARATHYRGYADEWSRIWNLKLREHKVDIERAMLYGNSASVNSINYTDGIVGHIIVNSQSQLADNAQLSYTEDKGYFSTRTDAQVTYDAFLADLEVVFDPARGGSSSKLALCSLPVITMFNKMGDAGFIDNSTVSTQAQYMIERAQGSFGHKVMKIDTVHGDLTLVKEPIFRGHAAGFMALVDLDQVSYRPLVGNGINRDTHITTNVQAADEDLRKDMILTEAGLEVSLPEAHALFNFEDKYTSS